MIDPENVLIEDGSGIEKEFILSKLPATVGRELAVVYLPSALPKIGDYAVNEKMMLKLLSYVGVEVSGNTQMLSSRSLIDNHVSDAEQLFRLEAAMIRKNFGFFRNGGVSTFLSQVQIQTGTAISKMLTDLLAQSSQTGKQA